MRYTERFHLSRKAYLNKLLWQTSKHNFSTIYSSMKLTYSCTIMNQTTFDPTNLYDYGMIMSMLIVTFRGAFEVVKFNLFGYCWSVPHICIIIYLKNCPRMTIQYRYILFKFCVDNYKDMKKHLGYHSWFHKLQIYSFFLWLIFSLPFRSDIRTRTLYHENCRAFIEQEYA